MTILEEILGYKKTEVKTNKKQFPVSELEKSRFFNRDCLSFKKALMADNSTGIIAEFKKASPSKGSINALAKVEEVTTGYVKNGACALSVLTDVKYFEGANQYLVNARKMNDCPILRKDFIIDEYQILEAKSIGADIILLIAAGLKPLQVKSLAGFAKSLGLEVLLEIHSEDELWAINENIDIVGVNNRDLKTFRVDIQSSVKLSNRIPDRFVKISESGISSAKAINKLLTYGYRGFLIGEAFMSKPDPPKALAKLVEELELIHLS
jgi:indole-3-glycerol phosphate synthase